MKFQTNDYYVARDEIEGIVSDYMLTTTSNYLDNEYVSYDDDMFYELHEKATNLITNNIMKIDRYASIDTISFLCENVTLNDMYIISELAWKRLITRKGVNMRIENEYLKTLKKTAKKSIKILKQGYRYSYIGIAKSIRVKMELDYIDIINNEYKIKKYFKVKNRLIKRS